MQDNPAKELSPELHQQPVSQDPDPRHQAPPATAPRQAPQTRVNNADPASKVMTQDHLLQLIGYLKPKSFLCNLNLLGNGTFKVSHIDRNPTLSSSKTASVKST